MRTKVSDVLDARGLVGLLCILLWIPVWWVVIPFLVVIWLNLEPISLEVGLMVAAGGVIAASGASAMWRWFLDGHRDVRRAYRDERSSTQLPAPRPPPTN